MSGPVRDEAIEATNTLIPDALGAIRDPAETYRYPSAITSRNRCPNFCSLAVPTP